MKLKNAVRALTPPLVWEAMKLAKRNVWDRGAEPLLSRYHGLQELDKKLEKYVDIDGGFFIEIGGWDGVTFSNSLYFERHRNWRGVLVEPAPSEYLKCRRNRPNAKVFCFACVPFDYTDKYVPMVYCASMSVTNVADLAFDPRAHAEDGRKFLAEGEDLYEFGAVAKPLSTILAENDITDAIDLLILDVEGYELPVLKGIDFARHAPRFICVEAWDLAAITTFLAAKGYEYVEQISKHDHLFRRSGADAGSR
ncbi:MAG TPA: FkbM family methyltransferase [Thermoanaerobaculia bacterium]|nr:FkbM family methyltransferase [Thermoanaerobaculia bacterium]